MQSSNAMRRSPYGRSRRTSETSTNGDESTIYTDGASTANNGASVGSLGALLDHDQDVTFLLKERIWASAATRCSIKRTDGKPVPNGMNILVKESTRRDSSGDIRKSNKVVIRDDRKHVMAVCSKSTSSSSSTEDFVSYRMLGTVPTVPDQKPAKKTVNSKIGLYEWVELRGVPGSSEYTVGIWNGTTYEPSFVCLKKPAYKTYTFYCSDNGRPCGSMTKAPGRIAPKSLLVSVLAGFDPCMLLGVATMIEDLNAISAQNERQSLQELALSLSGIMHEAKGVHKLSATSFVKKEGEHASSPDDTTSGSSADGAVKAPAKGSLLTGRAA